MSVGSSSRWSLRAAARSIRSLPAHAAAKFLLPERQVPVGYDTGLVLLSFVATAVARPGTCGRRRQKARRTDSCA